MGETAVAKEIHTLVIGGGPFWSCHWAVLRLGGVSFSIVEKATRSDMPGIIITTECIFIL